MKWIILIGIILLVGCAETNRRVTPISDIDLVGTNGNPNGMCFIDNIDYKKQCLVTLMRIHKYNSTPQIDYDITYRLNKSNYVCTYLHTNRDNTSINFSIDYGDSMNTAPFVISRHIFVAYRSNCLGINRIWIGGQTWEQTYGYNFNKWSNNDYDIFLNSFDHPESFLDSKGIFIPSFVLLGEVAEE